MSTALDLLAVAACIAALAVLAGFILTAACVVAES